MQEKMRSEIKRQAIHFVACIAAIISTIYLGAVSVLFLFAGIFIIGFAVSSLMKRGIEIPFCEKILRHVQRGHEKNLPGKGALILVLAIIVLLALNLVYFQNAKIVIGALVVLAVGDSIAPLVGMKFGRIKIGKKSIEGTIAGAIASFLFLLLLFPAHIAYIAAFVGMLAEFLPGDDNFAIPIVSALTLKILI